MGYYYLSGLGAISGQAAYDDARAMLTMLDYLNKDPKVDWSYDGYKVLQSEQANVRETIISLDGKLANAVNSLRSEIQSAINDSAGTTQYDDWIKYMDPIIKNKTIQVVPFSIWKSLRGWADKYTAAIEFYCKVLSAAYVKLSHLDKAISELSQHLEDQKRFAAREAKAAASTLPVAAKLPGLLPQLITALPRPITAMTLGPGYTSSAVAPSTARSATIPKLPGTGYSPSSSGPPTTPSSTGPAPVTKTRSSLPGTGYSPSSTTPTTPTGSKESAMFQTTPSSPTSDGSRGGYSNGSGTGTSKTPPPKEEDEDVEEPDEEVTWLDTVKEHWPWFVTGGLVVVGGASYGIYKLATR